MMMPLDKFNSLVFRNCNLHRVLYPRAKLGNWINGEMQIPAAWPHRESVEQMFVS